MSEKLALSPADVGALVGLADVTAMTTGDQASELISILKVKMDEERPPSPKQLGLVRSLAKKLTLTETDAAELVGAADFSSLTGGHKGTASALIDALRAKQKAATVAGSGPATAAPAATRPRTTDPVETDRAGKDRS